MYIFMNNLEDNLRKIKIKGLAEEDKDSLWHSIMVKRVEMENNKSRLLVFNMFNFSMKKIIVGFVALFLVLGGSGMVAASNNAVPGSFLFPVELALENIQIKLSSDDKKEELRLRFAEERLEEIREISEKRSAPSNALVADLSDSTVLAIEADVFTNETTVKIEANDKNYGYISALKTKAELVKEISLKYFIAEEKVNSVIDFEVEDRTSRSDDKGFLNKTRSINFSDDESKDVSEVLSDIEEFLGDEDTNKEELRKSLAEILVLLGDDGKLEIRRDDGKIKIETKNGEVKIKMETKEDDSGKNSDDDNDSKEGKSEDDDSKDDDESDDHGSDDSSLLNDNDVKEDDGEVFCRGEWRDPEDCEDDDNSGSSKDEDGDDDHDDDSDDSDDDDGEDKDDDNSGSGGGDDD